MPVMRLQRALARAGVASRRKAEELIVSGQVAINGAVASLGQSVDTVHDTIEVAGRRIQLAERETWIALHKPAGVLTAASDSRGRSTVFDLIPERTPGLTYVGRLDYLTEGLLLLTTDGAAVHRLTHPSSGVERVYIASVRGDGRSGAVAMRAGVELDGRMSRPARVRAERSSRGRWELELTLAEGRNREVRRLCEAVGLEVERLIRVRFGPVTLGRLSAGKTRPLTPRERLLIQGIARGSTPG